MYSGQGLRVKALEGHGCRPLLGGTTYALTLQAGGELTQMDVTFVPPRFKDSYGPVGTFFLLFKTPATNAYDGPYVGAYPSELQTSGRLMQMRSPVRLL